MAGKPRGRVIAALATALAIAFAATALADVDLGTIGGLTYIGENASVDAGNDGEITVDCPTGQSAVGGGGYAYYSGHEGVPHSSGPADGPDENLKADDGWRYDVHAASDGAGVLDVSAIAVCADETPKSVTQKASVGAGGTGSAMAPCPAGTHVSGGGVIIGGSIADAHLNSSYPYDDGDGGKAPDDGWKGRVANLAGKKKPMRVIALCVPSHRSYETVGGTSSNGDATQVYCDEGHYVTGAGAKISGSAGGARLDEAIPDDDPFEPEEIPSERVVVAFDKLSGAQRSYTFYAVCK